MNSILIAFIAVICNVAAQLAMKYSGKSMVQTTGVLGFFSYWLVAAVVLYGISFILTVRVYADNPISIASPLMAGGTFILIAITSYLVLHETMSIQKILGMILIIAGIFVLCKK